MKKLFALLLLVTSTVYAEEWMEMPNNAGGKMLFLPNKCDDSKSAGRLVISTLPEGSTIRGCWYFFADMIHVVWISPQNFYGQTSAFDPKTMSYKKQ